MSQLRFTRFQAFLRRDVDRQHPQEDRLGPVPVPWLRKEVHQQMLRQPSRRSRVRLNTPHFGLPGTNVSDLVLNPEGSIKNLAGYTTITSTQNLWRDFDESHFRCRLRLSF